MQINKSIITSLVLLLTFNILIAQTYRHPYSSYGIGELQERTFSINSSLGGLSLGWNDPLSYTPANPASFSHLKFTCFDMGINTKIKNFTQEDLNYTSTYPSFSYFGLGFPINKKGWGAGFGLLPLSIIDSKDSYIVNNDSITMVDKFDINGGVSKFFIGNSIRLAKKLNIGLNLAYIFGNSTQNHSLEFEENSNYLSFKTKTERFIGNLALDFGGQFMSKIKNINLTIGAVVSLPIDFKINEEIVSYTYEHLGTANIIKDSLFYEENENNILHLPPKFGIGIMIDSTDKWKLGIDFNYEKWSEFKIPDQSYDLNDMWEIIVGGEFIPDNKSINKYFQRVSYRFGIKYVHSYLKIDDNDLNKISLSLGVGFPVAKNSANINLGVEGGKYIETESSVIQESFLNIYLGFRLNDIWFRKAKID